MSHVRSMWDMQRMSSDENCPCMISRERPVQIGRIYRQVETRVKHTIEQRANTG